ncbi:MAG: sensor histidine kinase [Ktedonobacterales bacterium]
MIARVLPRVRGWRDRWNTLWFSADPARALGEVLLVQTPVLLWALLFKLGTPQVGLVRVVLTLIVPMGPGCILWCVFRMRRPPWPWGARLALYTVIGAFIGITPATLLTELWHAQILLSVRPRFPLDWFAVIWLVAFTGAFVLSRLSARLLLMWNELRQRHLVWALTHAHLLVVVLVMSLVVGLVVTVELLTSRTVPLQLLPVLFFLFILTIVMLLIVLPPSALFSYLFAIRTTRRLNVLADATTGLRAGDYTIRVPVQGADEVAQLQSNFNAMAADLERAVRELQAERDRVSALLVARRELVASVSHELRTPVATLRGYLESAREHWDAMPPPALRSDLAIMERETVRLQALIDDLFTLARAEVGRLEMRCEPVNVPAVAQRCIAAVAPLAWQRGRVEMTVAVAGAVPAAQADAARLEQVLHNLLHNAARHTPPGGIVAVTVAAEDDTVTLRVQDTGEGIAPDDLPRIWERFYRTARSRDQLDSGTGLGLALVKELTEMMGGSVGVESTLGVGSCFTVRLPRAAAVPAATNAPAVERAVERDRSAWQGVGGIR